MNNYIQLKCVFCNSSFTHLLGKQGLDPKYCSPRCHNRANYRKSINDGRVAKRLDEIKSKRRAERLNAPQVCAKCGKAFFYERKRKFCPDCNKPRERDSSTPWTELTWKHGFRRPPCKWCGKQCTWHGNVGYCSQECACADKVYRRKYEIQKNERLLELGFFEYLPKEVLVSEKRKLFKTLIKLAKRILQKKKKEVVEPKTCRWCGKSFYRIASHSGSYVYCSDTCQEEAKREQRRKERKSVACKEYKRSTRNNRKRARKYGCEYDSSIRRKAVFQRDGWKCRICGKATPERLLGKNKPNAPTLDHIVPLSLGGGHTWKNVQCACRQCNSEKSNRFVEPWLFPL